MKKIITILLVFATLFTFFVYAENQPVQDNLTLTDSEPASVEGTENTQNDTDNALQSSVELSEAEQPLVEKDGLKIYEPVFTKTGSTTPVTSLLTVQSLHITIPAEVTADTPAEGVQLAVLVTLFEKDSNLEDGNFRGVFAPEEGVITLLPNEKKDVELTLDLSGYTPLQRRNLYVKVMLWDGYSTMKPYLVPAFEKFR